MSTPPPSPRPISEATEARFFSGIEPSPEQRAASDEIMRAVRLLGQVISDLTPQGRNQSLALTALEDCSQRANRSLYARGDAR